jgi:hypothetical protein
MYLGIRPTPPRKANNSVPPVRRFSTHCEILNISQTYGPALPVMGMTLSFNN